MLGLLGEKTPWVMSESMMKGVVNRKENGSRLAMRSEVIGESSIGGQVDFGEHDLHNRAFLFMSCCQVLRAVGVV
jgi:hypothetical protein